MLNHSIDSSKSIPDGEQHWAYADYVAPKVETEPKWGDLADEECGVVEIIAGMTLWLLLALSGAWLHHIVSLAVHP